MAEKTKLVKLPLKVWQEAKKAAIDRDESLTKWLSDAVLLKWTKEKGEKR